LSLRTAPFETIVVVVRLSPARFTLLVLALVVY
jgi:hypothetical protein